MRRLNSFNFVTLNGCFAGPKGDLTWHRHGGEESGYSEEGLASGNTLLFGRMTYELMVSYWPTPMAKASFPVVADGMNGAEKIVFSRTLKKAEWNNTRVVGGNIAEEIRKMKQLPGKDMTILGSGSIVTHFADEGLIDEFQVMIDPVALGDGTPLFSGIRRKLDLDLIGTRAFKSGVVLLTYRPQG